MFEDIEGVEVVVDDLILGESAQQHDSQVHNRARERNLKLNKQKCQIRKDKISYIGHTLTKDGLRPDSKKAEAIMSMPSPKNKKELQRFLLIGMLTNSFLISPILQHHYKTY